MRKRDFYVIISLIDTDNALRNGSEERMQNYNSEFFDEFKRLDKLCRELYGKTSDNKLGVTLYLEDMDSKSRRGASGVDGWMGDYNRLKHLRGVRNELAHSPDTFSRQMCDCEDVEFIRSFYSRILNGTDPLSVYFKKYGSERSAKSRTNARTTKSGDSGGATLKKVRSALGILHLIKRIFRLFSK